MEKSIKGGVRKAESAGWSRVLGYVIFLGIKLLSMSLRVSFRFENEEQSVANQGQFIAVIWHNRTLIPCYIYRSIMKDKRPMCMLTSASKDGALLTQIVKLFGMRTLRGSSHRRGATALLGVIKEIKKGANVCIATDGPTGPIYKSKPGAAKLASISGLPIVPVCLNFSSCWRVNSAWDKYIIPKPFSKVELFWCSELVVPPNITAEQELYYTELIDKMLSRGTPDFDVPCQ